MGPSTAGELCSKLEHRVQTALPELARALMGAPRTWLKRTLANASHVTHSFSMFETACDRVCNKAI